MSRHTRRDFLHLTMDATVGLGVGVLSPSLLAAGVIEPQSEKGFSWYDVKQWGVEGRGWNDTARYFDRLPARAEGVVRPPVWNLSRHSAGMCTRFITNATTIRVRYSLLSSSLAMPHMPATGVSGLDLYAQDENGRWRWTAVLGPTQQQVDATLASGLREGLRAYLVYLPLYNGVEDLAFGVPEGSIFEPIRPRTKDLIVYYGTSIAHGACASRPGMAFPAILGRRFDRPVVNLGFSGNGKMDIELADLLGELDAAVYCIDCLPNLVANEVTERTGPFVRRLRELRPKTPIVLIEDRTYTNSWIHVERRARNDSSRRAFRAAYQELRDQGVRSLYYVEGDHLLGDDNEAATDGSHPSDLGMMRMADALEKVLSPLLCD